MKYLFIEVGSATKLGHADVTLEPHPIRKELRVVAGTGIVVALSGGKRLPIPQCWIKPADRDAVSTLPDFQKFDRTLFRTKRDKAKSNRRHTVRPNLGD